MSITVTVNAPGHATGLATSTMGETYRFTAQQQDDRVSVTLYGKLKGRAGHARLMPRSTLRPLREDIAKACRRAPGWKEETPSS